MSFQKDLIENHNELLAIVRAHYEVNKTEISKSKYLKNKLERVIIRGAQIKKSVAATTDS